MKGTPRRRTALFLISDTGAGHRSAANAITAAMRLVDGQNALNGGNASTPRGRRDQRPDSAWRAVIVDGFAEGASFPLRKGVFLYGPAIKHSPRLYSQLFHLTNNVSRFNAAYRLSRPFLRQGLANLLQRYRPDVIVSVHPLLNHITLQVMRDLRVNVPFITVITDLISVHAAWVTAGVTACVAPTEVARDYAVARGVAPKRVRLLGMPIDPAFASEPAGDLRERKLALGLDPDRPAILLVGGGEGAGGLERAARALVHQDLGAQLIIVTGRNHALRAELERDRPAFRMPALILGFVDTMPQLMRAADMVVTKAGPGSISEAMACELPLVLTGYVPGQEEGNVAYVREHNLGVFADTPEKLVAAVRQLLDPTNPRLAEMRENVRAHSRPRASFDIARLILAHMPPPGAPSAWDAVPLSRRARISGAINRRRRWAIKRARSIAGAGVGRARMLADRSALAPITRTLGSLRAAGRLSRRAGLPGLEGSRALLLRPPSSASRARRHNSAG